MEPNQNDRVCFIVNPKAGSGSAKTKRRQLEERISQYFLNWEIRETQAAGHAEVIARECCHEGFDIIAPIGGDGTCHEVVNGMIHNDEPYSPNTSLALISAGTGSDFLKSIPTPQRSYSSLACSCLWTKQNYRHRKMYNPNRGSIFRKCCGIWCQRRGCREKQ